MLTGAAAVNARPLPAELANIGPRPSVPPLAHYRFDGTATDVTKANPNFELRNTEFREKALYLNGVYEFALGGGYRAVCKTPGLDYSAFTVAVRLKMIDLSQRGTSNLVMGGTSYRWFGLSCDGGWNVNVTLNNQRFRHAAVGGRLEKDKWAILVAGIDVPGRKLVTYLDGKKIADVTLPEGMVLEVSKSPAAQSDKVWSFTNYSNGSAFHGLVSELILYNSLLSPKNMERIPLRP